MKNIFNLAFVLGVTLGCASNCEASHARQPDLSEERVAAARALAADNSKFEDCVAQGKAKLMEENEDEELLNLIRNGQFLLACETVEASKKSMGEEGEWLTIENNNFLYKGNEQEFCIINGFSYDSMFGEVAVYPLNVKLNKVTYSSGRFNDIHARYLSTLQYEYIPAADSRPAYFIVENVEAGGGAEGKGYTQAALNYFINEFVIKRTDVKYVFSDLRNRVCCHFFPKYSFVQDIPEEVKDIKFARPMKVPYTWVSK
jgi:hypothetical protein